MLSLGSFPRPYSIRPNSNSLVGTAAVEYLGRFNADIAFMSCRGFSLQGGATEASEDEYRVKQVYLNNARRSVLLCDSTKKDREFLCRLAPLARFHAVLTERRELNKQLAEASAVNQPNK